MKNLSKRRIPNPFCNQNPITKPLISGKIQPTMNKDLPYKIACLCYLFDQNDNILLLHRIKPPNKHLYSPIGGKLEQKNGESPADCAIREIQEEVGLSLSTDQMHLTGLVSETAYQNQTHWLMFLYEVKKPVTISNMNCDEGELIWISKENLSNLDLPETDKNIIWPLFWKHRGGFFATHIDCTQNQLIHRLDESMPLR